METAVNADLLDTRGATARRADSARIAGGVALTVAVVAVAALGLAWFSQLVLELAPCKLCLEQRYAYYLDIPLGLLVAFLAWRRAPVWLLAAGLAVLGLMALGNAGLAAYHAGVEWRFWAGPSDCSGPILDLSKAGGLLAQLDKVKVVRCDEVQWRFLGLSFAGYNVLMSLALAALCGWGLARLRR
ncbi:MAG: disulfide bond formation protein B [Rhodopseudomonas sp.]|uniref:disulfide bond formation protein B n=1 Tax=Rhodopseudomonas sp. BR0M22 TaxID=2269369 RepID=UPI001968452A|nr:disulfide bond formation protein B [Rhodopseudomonas sp. BR0M22]